MFFLGAGPLFAVYSQGDDPLVLGVLENGTTVTSCAGQQGLGVARGAVWSVSRPWQWLRSRGGGWRTKVLFLCLFSSTLANFAFWGFPSAVSLSSDGLRFPL